MRRSTRKSTIGLTEDPPNPPTGNFSTRFSLPSFTKRVEKLTENQKNAIHKLGFGNLLLLSNQMLNKNLLVELMERWSCEERAFVLLPGNLKITPMDVVLILGLSVVGDPVILKEDEPLMELEKEYGAALGKRKISVSLLESRLDSIGDAVNENFIRTFILFMFGTIVFPSTSGKVVDSRYLSFLKDLDNVGCFSWGGAVLDDLTMWLDKRKETSVQYIGGCLILLQIWSYEHIDLARPGLVENCSRFPRASRWENIRPNQRQWFNSLFKELQFHQITWELQPTPEELEFDIVKELLKIDNELEDDSSLQCSASGDSFHDVGLQAESPESSSNNDLQEQREAEDLEQPLGLQDADNANEAQEQSEAENELQLRVVPDSPEEQMESIEDLTTSCASGLRMGHVKLSSQWQNSSTNNITMGNEKELIKRIQQLEAELSSKNQLEAELMGLKNENMELKNEIGNLRTENGELRNKILLTDNLVTRLEGLLMDETYPS